MRMLLKAEWDIEAGNKVMQSGKLPGYIKSILGEMKPEAAYFVALNGKRCALIFFDLKDPSHLPAVAEPWFMLFNAAITVCPAMTPEDLAKAGPGIEKALKKYA